MDELGMIQVRTADTGPASTTRGGSRGRDSIQLIEIEALAQNVRRFLSQIETILGETPEEVSGFVLDELTVQAEVEASGKLVLLGSGVEASAKGGMTFTFKKRPLKKDVGD